MLRLVEEHGDGFVKQGLLPSMPQCKHPEPPVLILVVRILSGCFMSSRAISLMDCILANMSLSAEVSHFNMSPLLSSIWANQRCSLGQRSFLGVPWSPSELTRGDDSAGTTTVDTAAAADAEAVIVQTGRLRTKLGCVQVGPTRGFEPKFVRHMCYASSRQGYVWVLYTNTNMDLWSVHLI